MDLQPSNPVSREPSPQSLSSRISALLQDADKDQEKRRRTTERVMEDVDRRLKHVAYLIADLNLRYVIPKLKELGEMFHQSMGPRKQGVCDSIWVDFLPTDEYPAQARVSVGMMPLPSADKLRVTISVIMLPVHLPYDHEASFELLVQNPDGKSFEEFLDARILQFVKDYLRVRDPESPYHDEQKVTDPVCQMTFSVAEAAGSGVFKDRTYYFCVDSCRRKFELAPERYVIHPPTIQELPGHEQLPLLGATPGDPHPNRYADRNIGERAARSK
jgi:YHS domain-containing protein